LVVGESASLATALEILADHCLTVRHVVGQAAGVEALDGVPPDLLIVDDSGGVDAVEFCRGVRARPGLADVHVLALVPERARSRAGELLAAGADDWLGTPFDQPTLLARVRAGVYHTQLVACEARLRALMAVVPGAVYRCALDADWTMQVIGDEIKSITGYPASDFVDNACRSFASVIHPDDRAQVEQDVWTAIDAGRSFNLEYRIVRADGTVGWVLERGELARSGPAVWLDGVIFNLTPRKQAEEELRANQARQAADEERARIARELHDSVSQALFSITLHARAAELALERGGVGQHHPAARNVAQLHDLTQGALAEMRALIFELRPKELAEEGLVAAIRKQAAALTAREGLPITVDGPWERLNLPDGAEEHLYRIVQEALNNTIKHAAASRAAVTVRGGLDVVTITVDDDGCGFDTAVEHAGHFGRGTMTDRAAAIGADLAIRSAPGAGTTLTVRLARAGVSPAIAEAGPP
jgi:PAS domain S-box-containing protein